MGFLRKYLEEIKGGRKWVAVQKYSATGILSLLLATLLSEYCTVK
jgi:hypothetical protein